MRGFAPAACVVAVVGCARAVGLTPAGGNDDSGVSVDIRSAADATAGPPGMDEASSGVSSGSSSSSSSSGSGSGAGIDAGSAGTGAGRGGGNDGASSSATSEGGGCALPMPAKTGVTACDQCQEANCCTELITCLASAPCAALFGCTMACSGGKLPDGGTIDPDSSTAVDNCWVRCESGANTAAIDAFRTQDDCVNYSCQTPCAIY
jgi:hypothetical protein